MKAITTAEVITLAATEQVELFINGIALQFTTGGTTYELSTVQSEIDAWDTAIHTNAITFTPTPEALVIAEGNEDLANEEGPWFVLVQQHA